MSETTDLVPEDKSPAAQQRARLEAFMGELAKRNAQLGTLLSDSDIDPRKFLEVARRAFMRNPDLLKCDAGSIIEAFINAANDGLLPDGRQGAVVPYNVNIAAKGKPKQFVKKAQWIPMVQGLLDVAHRSGNFRSIQARVVYAGDEFTYHYDPHPVVRHVPGRRPAGTVPEIVAAYAIAVTKDDGLYFEPFEGNDIAKVKAASRALSGPWIGWSEEMTRKGPLRRLWKYLPKDNRMARVGAREDELYDIDIEGLEEEEETPRALRAGFSKPPQQALPQGADLIMDTEAPMETEMEPVPQEAGEGPAAAQPPSPPAPEPIQKEDAVEDAFEISLRVAKSWLNVKQAIRGIAKTGWPTDEQWAMAWDTFITTGDKVDILADPFLFRCWLESGPSADAIDGNLRVMELDSAFQKLSDDAKTRIRERCAEVKES